MNLFELKNEHERLLAQAINLETGEIRDEEALALFEKNEHDLDQKAIAYAIVIKTLNAQAVAIEAVIEPLTHRKNVLYNEVERLRDNLRVLGVQEDFKAVDPRATVSVRGGLVIAEIVNETAIPKKYFETRQLLKKGDVLAALKAGEKVRGARLGQGKRVVTIR